MIQLTPQSRIFIAIDPEDFRKGIDGIANSCRQKLDADPFSGAIFVFRNRSRTAIKILAYDGAGFWLCMRRLSKGKLNWWPTSEDPAVSLSHKELQLILWNTNAQEVSLQSDWRKVA